MLMEGSNFTIESIGQDFVIAHITGTLTAYYGVWTYDVLEKIEDLPK